MLGLGDRLELAPGVEARLRRVDDAVRGESWPLNDAASFVLARRDRPLGAIAEELAVHWNLQPGRARDDVLAFAWALNRALLVNVRRGPGRRRLVERAALTVRLLPSGTLPPPAAHRRALDTRTTRASLASACRAALARAALVACAVAAAGLAAAGTGGALLLDAVVIGAATGTGIAVHEAGHAAALRGIPAALVLVGLRTFTLHRPLRPGRRALVAAAGPALAAVAGCLTVTLGAGVGVPELTLAGAPLASHAVGLGVLTRDGRAACGL